MQTPATRPQAGAGKPPPKGGSASTGAPAQCTFSSLGLASCCIDPVYGLYRAMDPIPRAHGNVKPFTHLGDERVCVVRHSVALFLKPGLSNHSLSQRLSFLRAKGGSCHRTANGLFQGRRSTVLHGRSILCCAMMLRIYQTEPKQSQSKAKQKCQFGAGIPRGVRQGR